MIVGYTGLPGSGKSFTAVKHLVIPAIKSGRKVVTNIDLKIEEILKDFPEADIQHEPDLTRFEPEQLVQIDPGAVIVIDEAWELFPSGMKANQAGADFISFLSEHRHRVKDGKSQEIALLVQDLAMIAAFARQLVDKTYKTKKLDALGKDNAYVVTCYQGGPTGQNIPERLVLDSTQGKYDPKFYKYYRTHSKSDGSFGDEEKIDQRSNIGAKYKRMVYGGFGAAALFAALAFYKLITSFGADEPETQTEQQLPTDPAAALIASVQDQQPIDVRQEYDFSDRYRIVGFIEKKRGGWYQKVVVISNGKHSVSAPYNDNCEPQTGFTKHHCYFRNQIVTLTTGRDKDFRNDKKVGVLSSGAGLIDDLQS